MRESVREKLMEICSGRVEFSLPIAEYTSMGVGGTVDAFVYPRTFEEVKQIIRYLNAVGIPFLPVGRMTNIIVRDGGYRGVFLSLAELRQVRIEEDGNQVVIYAQAGVSLAQMVSLCVEKGFGGVEFCAGIPGTVGGALRMNAGAFGREIKDVTRAVDFVFPNGEIKTVAAEKLLFCYRKLDVPESTVIVGGSFVLWRDDPSKVGGYVRDILRKRKEKHPQEFKSVGSVFKNPEGYVAGRLIEEVGLKGLTLGGAQVSEKHGNFIVNLGNARAKDILTLMEMVREKVYREKGVLLESEVVVVGDD
ncbi:MAG: UDP-N-acetylmuramate dehydrogenase [Syntrophales bacterium]|nr:UDP-N-acetylmuramate dehydrogenase [Syntrophales bacterium]